MKVVFLVCYSDYFLIFKTNISEEHFYLFNFCVVYPISSTSIL